MHAARLDEHATELAEHFSHSSDPSDLAKAIAFGEMAAKRATAVFAYWESVDHLDRCLQVQEVLDPGDKGKRCDLLLALGDALLLGEEPQRILDLVSPEALSLAEDLDDTIRLCRACQLALWGLHHSWGLWRWAPLSLRSGWTGWTGTPSRIRWSVSMQTSI